MCSPLWVCTSSTAERTRTCTALWSTGAVAMGHDDLTALSHAPAAEGNPFGYVFDALGMQNVVYRGADGHLHCLYWSTGAVGHDDLTALSHAPHPLGNPFGYVFDALGMQNVVYRGADTHLHCLYWWTGAVAMTTSRPCREHLRPAETRRRTLPPPIACRTSCTAERRRAPALPVLVDRGGPAMTTSRPPPGFTSCRYQVRWVTHHRLLRGCRRHTSRDLPKQRRTPARDMVTTGPVRQQ